MDKIFRFCTLESKYINTGGFSRIPGGKKVFDSKTTIFPNFKEILWGLLQELDTS